MPWRPGVLYYIFSLDLAIEPTRFERVGRRAAGQVGTGGEGARAKIFFNF